MQARRSGGHATDTDVVETAASRGIDDSARGQQNLAGGGQEASSNHVTNLPTIAANTVDHDASKIFSVQIKVCCQ